MTILYNTGDWFPLGQGNTFRKFDIYNLDWLQRADLERMLVIGAPYGGPIAITKDPNIFSVVKTQTKPIIKIFTSSGNPLGTVTWKGGCLIKIGWTESEELLCVEDNGVVTIFDMFGNFKHKFSMGSEVKNTKIIDARIYPSSAETGVAVMTTKFRIFFVNSTKEQKIRQLPEVDSPSTWEIITENRNTSCIVTKEKEVFKLTQGDKTIINIAMRNEYESIVKIGVSFNHKHVALYTNNGHVWMGSSDFSRQYCEFNTGRSEKPRDIAWIIDSEGDDKADAIVIAYSSLLLVIGFNGDSNAYAYDPAIFLIPEMDCVRVLSTGCHEMIQKIPKCIDDTFAINSQKSSSFLFEAHKKFLERSHKSDEYLCLAKSKLDEAVQNCIDAACYEFDTTIQKSLLNAAYFGKGFIHGFNPDDYIRKSRFLRVLNALRHENIGIPLTFVQFNHLKPNVILDRLVFRKHYGLAIQIAKHLKLSESRILRHWAFYKIINEKNDRDVVKKISEKLKSPIEQEVRFYEIAKKAEECGRKDLAIMLLELETKPNFQVPLLLKVGEYKKALAAATKSGNPDLVYTVLLQLKQNTALADFTMIIRSFPMAQNLYKKYCMKCSVSALRDIYNQEDDFLSQAQFSLRECIETKKVDSFLQIIGPLYKKAQKDVEAELCEEAKKLVRQQKLLDSQQSFSGLSVHDTIKQLLYSGDIKTAEKYKNEYKVPDKRFWWLRIQVLAELGQWEELDKFSKIKKSPIGYEPFVDVCLNRDKQMEAKKYIFRCRDDIKAHLFIKAKLHEDAAQILFDLKDIKGLWNIHGLASTSANAALIIKTENFIGILSAKK